MDDEGSGHSTSMLCSVSNIQHAQLGSQLIVANLACYFSLPGALLIDRFCLFVLIQLISLLILLLILRQVDLA